MNKRQYGLIMVLALAAGLVGGVIASQFFVKKELAWITPLGAIGSCLAAAAALVTAYLTKQATGLAKDAAESSQESVEAAWQPSASFALKQTEEDPYHFLFFLVNHSKFSINCWAKLNATIYGRPVSGQGFYDGKSSFDLQPFAQGQGHFDLRPLVEQAGMEIEDLEKEVDNSNYMKQLHFDIEFWYNKVDSEEIVRNIKQPHFFDFRRKILVADF